MGGLESGVPMTYVKLMQDTILSPSLQDEIIATLGSAEVVELEAGHDAMVSQPEALAGLLNDLAAPGD